MFRRGVSLLGSTPTAAVLLQRYGVATALRPPLSFAASFVFRGLAFPRRLLGALHSIHAM